MILWNTSGKMIEGMHSGRVWEFAPNEQKKVHDPEVFNHLFFKLKSKGLVLLNEENLTDESKKKALIEGLKARWKSLDFVVRNYRTMNKDRESNKLAAEAPSETVMNCAEEAAEILETLKKLEGEKYKKVEAYLNDDRTKKMAENIADSEKTVETQGSFETKIAPKGSKKAQKSATPSTANT